jgi:hypothetical protein
MWRNGRRNGLKIRWAVKGPCRFESGHRHLMGANEGEALGISNSRTEMLASQITKR